MCVHALRGVGSNNHNKFKFASIRGGSIPTNFSPYSRFTQKRRAKSAQQMTTQKSTAQLQFRVDETNNWTGQTPETSRMLTCEEATTYRWPVRKLALALAQNEGQSELNISPKRKNKMLPREHLLQPFTLSGALFYPEHSKNEQTVPFPSTRPFDNHPELE